MGYIAAEKLVNMGYTRVVHFQDGMRAWKKTGKQLIYRLK
jgi:rhodanese-related sulfurtransferase